MVRFPNSNLKFDPSGKPLLRQSGSSFKPAPPYYTTSKPAERLLHTLPTEILGEIFIRCLPYMNGRLYPRFWDAPMLLCQICTRWREVALGMPMLWAKFSGTPSPEKNRHNYISLMRMWLERSRPCPLSFEIRAFEDRERSVEASFPLFLSEINRWHTVDLILNKVTCQQFLDVSSSGSGSLLDKLRLDAFGCTKEQLFNLPTVFNNFTRLRQLDFCRPGITSLLHVQWLHLTHIRLHTFLPMHQCIYILAQCLDVVDCTLTAIRPQNSVPLSNNILLPKLVALHLRSDDDVGPILSHLTCPAIRKLTIENDMVPGSRDTRSFRDFLSRSSCKLESLCLGDPCASEGDVINYITVPGLQYLKRLVIGGKQTGDKALSLFAISSDGDGSEVIMPCVEALFLHVGQVSDNLLADIIASRIRVTDEELSLGKVAQLKEVRVTFYQMDFEHNLEDSHPGDLKEFREFRDAGLNITWNLRSC